MCIFTFTLHNSHARKKDIQKASFSRFLDFLAQKKHFLQKKINKMKRISGTTAKSRQRKFVPSSQPGPFAVVATSRKSQTKVGTLACFDLL